MAQVRDTILKKYGIDIEKEDIPKLYKITNPNLSDAELEACISACRTKWNKGLNSPNEALAAKFSGYLEKADRYEEILRNPTLRQGLFGGGSAKSETGEVSALTRKYFSLISATRRIKKPELDFFLNYFPKEKKNRKSIEAFLKKEYKAVIVSFGGSGKEEEEKEEKEETEQPAKPSGFIENLFSEQTVLSLRKCELNFQEAREKPAVMNRYPELSDSLYEYLGIGGFDQAEAFEAYINRQKEAVYAVRDEFGTDYVCLVDLFNSISSLLRKSDVVNNFPEFKLLIMYPALTPYMYEIEEIKSKSLNQLYEIASSEYSFHSMPDFLVSYFNVIYDNFGIYADSVRKTMKQAQKQEGKQKAINAMYAAVGMTRGTSMPAAIRGVFALAYWPLYLLYFIFTVVRFVIEKMRYFGIGVGVLLSVISIVDCDVVNELLHWSDFLHEITGLEQLGFLSGVFANLQGILLILCEIFAAGLIVGSFFWTLSVLMRKSIDLIGISRSIAALIENAKKRTREQYEASSNAVMQKKLPMIVTNFAFLAAILIGVLILVM